MSEQTFVIIEKINDQTFAQEVFLENVEQAKGWAMATRKFCFGDVVICTEMHKPLARQVGECGPWFSFE